jgi:hypothetical protein
MRRLLAIFVLAVMGCSSVAPAALAASSAATPACCRRDGKHHCQTGMADMPGGSTDRDSTPKLRATTPDCPHRVLSTTPTAAGQAETSEFSTPLPAASSLLAQPNSVGFDSQSELRNSERGPPSSH